MKPTYKNLTRPDDQGRIPILEILRATGVNMGDVGSRRYKAWVLTHEINHIYIHPDNTYDDEYSFYVSEENGDVVIFIVSDLSFRLVTTPNQYQLIKAYEKWGFKLGEND